MILFFCVLLGMDNFNIIKGDMLDKKYYNNHRDIIICHQTNCKTLNVIGLAKKIFDKYPEVGKEFFKTERKVGNVYIIKTKNNNVYIANLCAQNYQGKPTKYETFEMRLEWLRLCLEKLCIYLENKNCILYFPYGIGSNLAGGNLEDIHKCIKNTIGNKIEVVFFRL